MAAGSGKQPYYLTLKDGSPLSLAALWERWDKGDSPLETFTIITTVASPGLKDLHHRQPAIIDPRWFSNWLDPRTPLPALLELAREPHDGPFQRRAVSARVNRGRNDYERRSQNRPQSGDAKPFTGGAKLDRPGGPRSIPEVFCGTPEGCIKWSYTLKYGAVSSSRG